MQKKITTKNMVLCAFFAALTSVCSQIAIVLPFSPVPVSPAILCVICSGVILGPYSGAISQLVFLLAGAIGMPIFSRLQGGLAVFLNPSGGYLLSYPIVAFVAGFIAKTKKPSLLPYFSAFITGTLICYIFGTLWYILLTGSNIYVAISQCVLPFLVIDAVKIVLGSIFCKKLNSHIKHI